MARSPGKKTRAGAARFVTGGLGEVWNAREAAAADALRSGAEEIAASMKRHAAASLSQRAGRAAEAFHAASFNANARRAGDARVAATTDSLGLPGSSRDIVVLDQGAVCQSAQVKYHRSSLRTAAASQQAKYAGQQRIVPTEQVVQARDLLEDSAARCALQPNRAATAARRSEAAEQLSDRLSAGEVQSEPLTLNEAKALAQEPARLGRSANRIQLAGAIKQGAKSGAMFGGISALTSNFVQFSKGEKSGGDAVVDSLVETARSAATGAAVAGTSTVVRIAAANAGLRSLARSSAPTAIATGVVEIAIDGFRVISGEIDGDEFVGRCAETAVQSGGAWVGAEVGAVYGSAFGPVGTVIGGLAGGAAGYLGVSKLFR